MKIKSKEQKKEFSKTPKNKTKTFENISAMEMVDEESSQSGHNIFSNSNIPSFSSSSPSIDKKNMKTPTKLKTKKDIQLEKTTVNSHLLNQYHDKTLNNMYSNNESISAKTNSKQNMLMMDLKDRSNTSKITLDGLSNQTLSHLTLNTKQNFYNLASDSQFPDSYNDIGSLSELQIKSIIQQKMKMLDYYNEQISKNKNSLEYRYFLKNKRILNN